MYLVIDLLMFAEVHLLPALLEALLLDLLPLYCLSGLTCLLILVCLDCCFLLKMVFDYRLRLLICFDPFVRLLISIFLILPYQLILKRHS